MDDGIESGFWVVGHQAANESCDTQGDTFHDPLEDM